MELNEFIKRHTKKNENLLAIYSNNKHYAILTKYKEIYYIYQHDIIENKTKKYISYTETDAYYTFYSTIKFIEPLIKYVKQFDTYE